MAADLDTDRLVYSKDQLLESARPVEALIANGMRCHGGFDADGNYFSPRTVHRVPGRRRYWPGLCNVCRILLTPVSHRVVCLVCCQLCRTPRASLRLVMRRDTLSYNASAITFSTLAFNAICWPNW